VARSSHCRSAFVRDEFPSERVPSLVGILSAVIAGGGGLGIVLAGPVVQNLDWRWLFWIPLLIIGLAMLAAYRYVLNLRRVTPAAWTGLPRPHCRAGWSRCFSP